MVLESNNKKIAKNTVALYFRLVVSVLISLYTSRIVLQTLGVTDYGVYGVIGGVLSMFTVLNGSMSSATSRFLTFELGTGNVSKLQSVFNSAMWIHIGIALMVAFLCESVGIWLLNEHLVIPEERLNAAHWVFQMSILSMFFNVTQVPYNATILSHERMGVFAYVEIANSAFRLLIVFLLLVGDYDKLILYGILQCCVSVLIAVIYRIYCVRNFSECKIRLNIDKDITRQMLTFSGWDLYGNLSVMARSQGINILLNMFFGPLMNAASEIATRIQGVTLSFSTNVSTAVRPQIVKSYSTHEYERMISLMRNGARITFILMLFCSVPIMIEISYILKIWLGVIPEHTEVICLLTLLWNLIVSMNITQTQAIHATGRVKRISFLSGTLFMFVVPVTYLSFKMGMPYWIPYFYNVVAVSVCYFFNKKVLEESIPNYKFSKILIPDMLRGYAAISLCLGVAYLPHMFLEESFIRLLLTGLVSIVVVAFSAYFVVFPPAQRSKLINTVTEKILWLKK